MSDPKIKARTSDPTGTGVHNACDAKAGYAISQTQGYSRSHRTYPIVYSNIAHTVRRGPPTTSHGVSSSDLKPIPSFSAMGITTIVGHMPAINGRRRLSHLVHLLSMASKTTHPRYLKVQSQTFLCKALSGGPEPPSRQVILNRVIECTRREESPSVWTSWLPSSMLAINLILRPTDTLQAPTTSVGPEPTSKPSAYQRCNLSLTRAAGSQGVTGTIVGHSHTLQIMVLNGPTTAFPYDPASFVYISLQHIYPYTIHSTNVTELSSVKGI